MTHQQLIEAHGQLADRIALNVARWGDRYVCSSDYDELERRLIELQRRLGWIDS